jgi:hypothetical protein
MSTAARVIAVALVAIAAAATPAAADQQQVYTVEGRADASAENSRVAALDVAFATATREALADMLAPGDLMSHKADLDREVIGRARKWIASYKVTSDRTEGDQRKLEVAVRMDVDKLIVRLAELGIVIEVPEPEPVVTPATGGGRGVKATVLLRVTTARSTSASYGTTASRDVAGLAQVSAGVRAAGWQLIAAPASGPSVDKDDGFLDDDSARALAASAGAELAVIVGVEAPAAGEVRGSSEVAALARARVRIVRRDGVVGEGTALAGAHGTGDEVVGAAIAAAAADAFADASPAVAGDGGTGGGTIAPVSAGGDDVLIHITARDKRDTPAWTLVRAIRDKVATTKGAVVVIRRLSSREVVLGVRGGDRGPDKIARDIRDLAHKIDNSSFSAKADGNVVEVKVSGSP